MSKTQSKKLKNLPYNQLPQEYLGAILAAPHDDLPRLIAADWYAENEQEAMAQFIRDQIAKPSHQRKYIANIVAPSGSYAIEGYVCRGFVKSLHIREEHFYDQTCRWHVRPKYVATGPCPKCQQTGLIKGLWEFIYQQVPVEHVVFTNTYYRQYTFVPAGLNIFGHVSEYMVPGEGQQGYSAADQTDMWLARFQNLDKHVVLRFPDAYIAQMLVSRATVNLCRRVRHLPNLATPIPWTGPRCDIATTERRLLQFYNPRLRRD